MLVGGGLALIALALAGRAKAEDAPKPPRGGGGGGSGGGGSGGSGGSGGDAADEPAEEPGEPSSTTGDPETDVDVLLEEFVLTETQQATILDALKAWMHCSPSDYAVGFEALREALISGQEINYKEDLTGSDGEATMSMMVDWFTGLAANRCLLDDEDFADFRANPGAWTKDAEDAYTRAMQSSSAGEIGTILVTYPLPESRRKEVSERYARIYGSAVSSACARLRAAGRGDTAAVNAAHQLQNTASRGLVPSLDHQLGTCLAENVPRIMQ